MINIQTKMLSKIIAKESLVYLNERKEFLDLLRQEYDNLVMINMPILEDELMGRLFTAWEQKQTPVIDIGSNEAPCILRNFLGDMLLYKKSTPYPYGIEYHLRDYKIIVITDKGSNNDLREYFQIVHEE